jgi:hypothetical protein
VWFLLKQRLLMGRVIPNQQIKHQARRDSIATDIKVRGDTNSPTKTAPGKRINREWIGAR